MVKKLKRNQKARSVMISRIALFGGVGLCLLLGLAAALNLPTIHRQENRIEGFLTASHNNVSSAVAEGNICGNKGPAPAQYKHVIWIFEENRDLGEVIGSRFAPFVTSLAHQCGYSTNFTDNEPEQAFGFGHHSLSHYLADTSGSNCMIGNALKGVGCLANGANKASQHSLSTVSIFEQVQNEGQTWKSYQESAPHNCALTNKGRYVARHDAAVYYSRIRPACQKFDIPIPPLQTQPKGQLIDDITNNTLPTFALVTPDLNHDMHDGTVAVGDAWLRAYLEPLLKSKSYIDGQTAVFIMWDEAAHNNQPIPNLVIAPTVRPGSVATSMNGFAVLGATEDMLDLPKLGCATGLPPGGIGQCYPGAVTNLRSEFNL